MKIPSEVLQKRIVDAIRYRFYDRLDLYDVYRWLDNFNDDEQELAVSVFEKLEYYREEDLLNILCKGLYHIDEDFWNEKGKTAHIRFMPLGRPGKSGHVIQYLVKNLLKTNRPPHTAAVSFYNHPKEIEAQTLTDEDLVVFSDDIIGSGNTFISDVKLTVEERKKNGEIVKAVMTNKKKQKEPGYITTDDKPKTGDTTGFIVVMLMLVAGISVLLIVFNVRHKKSGKKSKN